VRWKLNNEPAFPTISTPGNKDGMTLLDYFAAKALQPILESPNGLTIEGVAEAAYGIAEAMMVVRKQRGEQIG